MPDPGRWKALGGCLVAGVMTLLDVSIVNVALPSIRQGLAVLLVIYPFIEQQTWHSPLRPAMFPAAVLVGALGG